MSKSHHSERHIEYPLPPEQSQKMEMEIYARFMRHLRTVPNSRKEIKILSAIQFTADMTDNSDAHVAKILVELGLKAPRLAFPAEFLSHTDQMAAREETSYLNNQKTYADLHQYWMSSSKDKFEYLNREFAWSKSSRLRETV